MSKVRLVAYRKKAEISLTDSTYELDLQEAPNISLNFQFADIKEPEKRKANYSQTFKLPFTKNNNDFFQNWFNVNIETLVFDTRTRFGATIYVGTVPQFEGILQLRAVYQKAGLYEVVVLSASANLFNNIGGSKLRDAFLLADGTYSYELNHLFTADNVEKSWDGTATDFYSRTSSATQGPSLKDPDFNIQKVMYPINVGEEKFWFSPGANVYDVGSGGRLRLSQLVIQNWPAISLYNPVPPTFAATRLCQLKPAVQIKALLQLIIARAGFSYTSLFLDSEYFAKIFMTLGNKSSTAAPVVIQTPGVATGNSVVGYDQTTENFEWSAGQTVSTLYNLDIPMNKSVPDPTFSIPNDPNGVWNTTDNYFIRTDPAMMTMTIQFRSKYKNFTSYGTQFFMSFKAQALDYNTLNPVGSAFFVGIASVNSLSYGAGGYTQGFVDLRDLTLGVKYRIVADVPLSNSYIDDDSQECEFKLFNCKTQTGTCIDPSADLVTNGFSNMYALAAISWNGYDENIYNQVVDIPGNIDASITQKAFLKDIIERFNLVILPDPNDQENLLIEPYDKFISAGKILHWTDKLDLDKEIIVKDTTLMQKKSVLLSDQPDIDLMNKALADNAPTYNVWGKKELTFDNDFATGVMKNNSIFSPFITQAVFQGMDTSTGTACNMPVHYSLTYKVNNATETGYDNVLEPTKPKLFYYSGVPTAFENYQGTINKWYLHYFLIDEINSINPQAIGGFSDYMKAKEFTTFPKCSAYELSSEGNVDTNSRSLLWGDVPPVSQGLTLWSPNAISQKSLYHIYWANYLNSIYSPEARLMECHMNLNEVDIINFSFSDEVFIKDSYWRVLKIQNYQVGVKSSCKVTLLKVLDNYDNTCPDCGQVVAYTAEGQNAFDGLYLWCPETDPDCSPTLTSTYLLTSEVCCTCNGGNWFANAVNSAGLSHCEAMSGSLPVFRASVDAPLSIMQEIGVESIIAGKLSASNLPFVRGSNTAKRSRGLMGYMSDDIVIKYTNNKDGVGAAVPILHGESHRSILIGYTEGTTRGYAYPEGKREPGPVYTLMIPKESNMLIKVKGTATVIGGTSTTYPVGNTEGFSYYTAFKRVGDTITQLGTAGGTPEFALKEGGLTSTCSLNIAVDSSTFEVQFGLDDTQADTKRLWQLSVDLDVNEVNNMQLALDTNFALWQNLSGIQLENYEPLIWN